MSKNRFIDNVRVGSPCTEDWNKMHGNDRVRMCDHCVKEVNNLSKFTRKQAKRLVRASDGNICIRYYEHPVTKQPLFAAQFHQITRRTGIAASVVGASLSLATLSYADNGPNSTSPIAGGSKTAIVERRTAGEVVAKPSPTPPAEIVLEPVQPFPQGGNIVTVVSGGIGLSRDYSTPLTRAVDNDDIEEVRRLIANGANVNGRDEDYDRITPIFVAVENGNVEMVRLLIEVGAKVNIRNSEKQTPLMQLDGDATSELVKILVDAGAKVNLSDNENNTALLLAAENCSTDVIQALLDAGADVNLANKEGVTPLMHAAEKGDIESVRLILIGGAMVNARDEDGDNAWEYANEKEIEDLLVSFGSETRFIEPEGNYEEPEDKEKPAIVINY